MNMRTIRIENWSVVSSKSNPYASPETASIRLTGNVYGHPRHYDGRFVETSRIISSSGPFVITRSGSHYILGEPCPKYLSWLEDYYPNIDLSNSLSEFTGICR